MISDVRPTVAAAITVEVTGEESATADRLRRWDATMTRNYGTPSVALSHGHGPWVVDVDGIEYLDFLGGIAVSVLGHCHPAVTTAVSEQVAKLGHVSNFYVSDPALELAETLVALACQGGLVNTARVFLCNSGTEANEAAFKLTRLTGRTRVIAAHGAFHGRTMGSLSLTGQVGKRGPFEPLVPGVEFVPYGDVAALQASMASGDPVAAIILEPIQGEAGVIPAPDGYLAGARAAADAAGALLILDEVQTGIGRTGAWFAFQREGVRPDAITLAKGLGGGMPIGALIAFDAAAELLQPGHHGSTFGGNPVCSAAALAVLRTAAAQDLPARAAALGEQLAARLQAAAHPLIDRVRGHGLLRGVVLTAPVAAAVELAARERGLLVNAAVPGVIRLAPALVLTDAELDKGLDRLLAALDAVAATLEPGATEPAASNPAEARHS